MIGLWILGILLLLLIFLLLLRLGVEVSFGAQLCVKVRIGPGRIQILPRKGKRKDTKKEEDAAREAGTTRELDLALADIRPELPKLLRALKRALGKTRQRLLIKPMALSITIGGKDPATVGETYGWCNALVWQIMPQLEELVRMPDPYVHLDCDFTGGPTRAEGQLGLSLRVWDMLLIGTVLTMPVLDCLKRAKKRKAERLAREEKREQATKETSGDAAATRKDVTDGSESEK